MGDRESARARRNVRGGDRRDAGESASAAERRRSSQYEGRTGRASVARASRENRGSAGRIRDAPADPGTRDGEDASKLAIADEITAEQLDPAVRAELRTLPGQLGGAVARWLVAAGLEADPDRAYEYALQARRLAARVGVVRETVGIAAYHAGRWADALAELRTARRLTGRATYLPLMADSERALGRADRALAIIHDAAAAGALDRGTQIELLIVESGIRRDQERPAAGAAVLQVPELTDGRLRPWSARLFYAYADALLEAGREEEGREWFARAAAADTDEETDAAQRYEGLDSAVIEDLAESKDGGPADDEAERDAAVSERVQGGPERPGEQSEHTAERADGRPEAGRSRPTGPVGWPSR